MILSVVSFERKNIIFYKKNFKHTKNNTINNTFVIEFFLTISSYQFFKNYYIFINHSLFFREEYSL